MYTASHPLFQKGMLDKKDIGTHMPLRQRIADPQIRHRYPDNFDNKDILPLKKVNTEKSTIELILRLCQALESARITYCHWKSNNALDRSAIGENDLDLLVSRADVQQFVAILYRLGFKKANAPENTKMPGVLDYYGYDEASDKLVHVHAHFQLILGHDMTKNYRLPIERQYLESAVQGDLFKVPAYELEFIVFVIRMVLKHSTWDVILTNGGNLKPAERQELAYLQARINSDRVGEILKRLLPYITFELLNKCIRAIQPGCSTWRRVTIGHQLQVRLQANARRSLPIDIYMKLWRRVARAIRRRIFNSSPKYRLESGGALIALVGGDGAGKSTAVNALNTWLSKYFETKIMHMGKPAWSLTTIAIRGTLKFGNLLGLYPTAASFQKTLKQKSLISSGYPWLLREVCRARDRYRTYIKARRFAAKGGLVILDRFPLPLIKLMDGPQADRFMAQITTGPQAKRFLSPRRASRLTQALVRREGRYYQQIMLPDLIIILRVDPELAVQRRTDEDATFVRERSTEIWKLNWEQTDAHLVDGSKAKNDVLSKAKALIWSEL